MSGESPSKTKSTSSARRWFGATLATATALILVFWLAQVVGLSGEQLLVFLRENWASLSLFSFASLFLQGWFSALKWRIFHVDFRAGDAIGSRTAQLGFYSSTATLMAQFLPSPISVPIVRGLATRFDIGESFAKGAAITIYDQLFDVGVLVLVALICATIFLFGGATGLAISASLAALALALILARPIFAAVPIIALTRRAIPDWLPTSQRVKEALDEANRAGFDSPETCALLLRLSVLRYLAIGMRSCAAILLAIPTLPLIDAAWGFGVVQSSALLALTPGNLGITEWGWAGIEALLGIAAGSIVMAILGLRIVSIPATVAVMACFWAAFRISRKG